MITKALPRKILNLLNPVVFRKFGTEDKGQGNYGVKIDEQSIKRKMQEIKQRQQSFRKEEKKPQLLKNYKINKVKSETKKFRQMTQTQNLFQIQDVTLDEKPTVLNINSYGADNIEVDQFLYPPSIILTPHQLFLWEIKDIKQLSISDLKLIQIMNPPPLYILIGVANPQNISEQIRKYLQKLQVSYDILPLFQAVSNFNTYASQYHQMIAFINSIQ